MVASSQDRSSLKTLAVLKRDAERRAWLSQSFGAKVSPADDLGGLDHVLVRFSTLSQIACGETESGLSSRAFFGAHVHAILQEEAELSNFAIGFVRIRNGGQLDASVLRPMAQIMREALQPQDHLAEVRPAIFGVIAPATSGASLQERLEEAALSIASTTFFDSRAGRSSFYEAEVAMGRLDGRRTVEDVFRETRRCAVYDQTALQAVRAAQLRL